MTAVKPQQASIQQTVFASEYVSGEGSTAVLFVVCGFNCRASSPHLILLAGDDDTVHFVLHGLDVLLDGAQVKLEAGKLGSMVLHLRLHQTEGKRHNTTLEEQHTTHCTSSKTKKKTPHHSPLACDTRQQTDNIQQDSPFCTITWQHSLFCPSIDKCNTTQHNTR